MAPVDPKKTPPAVLLFEELNAPVVLQRIRLQQILGLLDTMEMGIPLQGVFVIAISGFETMLADVYRCYLHAVPTAFDFKEDKVSIEVLGNVARSKELIAQRIERHVNELAYGRLPSVLRRILKVLDLASPPLDEVLVDRILEAKETRNLILHSGLRVNQLYLDRAGPKARATRDAIGKLLPLSPSYVAATLADMQALVATIEERLSAKYGDFTKLKALRDLWDYLFNTPLMKFEDYWEVDESEDRIVDIKIYERESRLSSSERMFLGVLREHIRSYKDLPVTINMRYLDPHSQERMLFLLRVLGRFRF